MKIRFLGADKIVTGSCHLLEVNGKRILLDCGMFQGPKVIKKDSPVFLFDQGPCFPFQAPHGRIGVEADDPSGEATRKTTRQAG